MKKLITGFFILLLLCAIYLIPYQCSASETYYPADDWRTSTPEEQGVDSAKLVDMFHVIGDNDIEIRSLLIIRHGYLIAESYRDPFNRDTGQNIKSVTKSVISALAGIAIREKCIKSIDQKVAEFFPEYFGKNTDPRKKEITLRHLLTMTAGLQSTDDDTGKWSHSKDWLKYALDLPLTDTPGSRFNYSTGLVHLMSAIITRTSGMSTLEFGRKYLFDPLGIEVKKWSRDPMDIYIGGCELYITPRDMAKLGYLYLHHGVWDGQQIIPEEWVQESVKPSVKGNQGYGYGFWWWIYPDDYHAEGWGGQYIIINPRLDMVVIFTAADFKKPLDCLASYIYPAVSAEFSRKPNPAAVREMQALIATLACPKSASLSPAPEILKKINGKTYKCQKNSLGLTSFRMTFKGDICAVKMDKAEYQFPVGEGAYQVSNFEGPVTYFGERPTLPLNKGGPDQYQIAFRGQWLDDHTFLMEWMNYLGEPVKFMAQISFDGNEAEIKTTFLPLEWGGINYIYASQQKLF